ncbi:hypothetical protein BN997_00534 [Oceanobacillus oncorhynchi]|uniref:DUF4435 domain-containing protein n=1 Tax=Oceanobacillus oncorhynchi TaxID=545501 RepID=A0A0A1M616_9BACI|nr:DUF4435 domain-containing protein [Oceanobacillus oncorhynchi]CEI80725.1 hypothetical protein BN997_00534 [Oceanobacillus oncorhynchi]
MGINLSRDEILREKRNGRTVGYHKFTLKFKPRQRKPYCFIEGEDSKYYISRITMVCKAEPIFISCKGKKGVVETFNEIQKHND